MQWEAILMRFPDGNPEDIPKDWQPPPIGESAKVKSLLERAFPEADHHDGLSVVERDDCYVEFDYRPNEETNDTVRAVGVRSNAGSGSIPVLMLASERLGYRLLDLQHCEFTDFGPKIEVSFNDFVELRCRIRRERRWAFSLTAIPVVLLHVLQDSGLIPAIKPLSKATTGAYGVAGLLILNLLVFLSSVLLAMRQVQTIKAENRSQEEQYEIEEAILAPAFQGRGLPPSYIARYLHVAVAGFIGIIVGSVLAWGLSLAFF